MCNARNLEFVIFQYQKVRIGFMPAGITFFNAPNALNSDTLLGYPTLEYDELNRV